MLTRFGSLAAMAILALVVLAACGGDEVDVDADVTRVSAVGAPAMEEISDDIASPETDDAEAEDPEAVNAASDETPLTDTAASDEATAAEDVTVEMVDIDFNPNEFTILANTDVTVMLPNNGASEHNFVIDALEIDSGNIQPGETGEVTINAEPGEYEYYCSIPGHKQAGMVGTLTVSDDAASGDAATDDGESAATPGEGAAADGETAATPEEAEADEEAASGGEAEDVTVEMVDIDFNPNEFTIPANTDVTVTLPNDGAAVHNFNIDELGVESGDIPVGETGDVTINAEPGEYEYYCNTPGHKEAGMVGTLTVE